VSGNSVLVESAGGLVGVGRSVDVSGSESVRVGSSGAVVELTGSSDTEYVGYMWRSSASFSAFTNSVPEMHDVEEVVVRSGIAGGSRFESSGTVTVSLLLGASSSAPPVEVWGSSLGAGSYSMDGLRATFVRQSVVSVSLSSTGEGTFEDWSRTIFYFGRAVDTGSVRVASASVLEAVSGDSLSVSSQSVSLSAGSDLDVSSGGSVRVSSQSVEVLAEEEVRAQMGSLLASVAGSMELFSGGKVSITAEKLSLSSLGDVELLAGGVVSLAGESASVTVESDLSASAQRVSLHAGEEMRASAAEKISVTTEELRLDASHIEAFADDSASLTTRKASIGADKVRMRSQQLELQAAKSAKFHAMDEMKVESETLSFGGGAGRVRLSSTPKTAEVEVDTLVPAGVDAESEEFTTTYLQQLASLLGIPTSRLQVSAETVEGDSGR